MGAFVTNVQVRASADAVAACRRWLDAALEREGMRPAAEGEAVDRTIVLVHDRGWLSVYDEGTDVQDTDLLDQLGEGLSEAAGGHAFSVLVHDSDVLLLSLYRQGRRIDRYDSNPSYFGGRKRRGPPGPHVEAWAPVLEDPDALREALTAEPLMAEEALRPVARAVGIEPGRLWVGYGYLVEQGVPHGALILRYRLLERPAWEEAAGGPPHLTTVYPSPPVVAAVGAALQVSLTTRNTGGAGTGIVVQVEGGDAIVAWSEAQILVGDPRRGGKHVMLPIVDGRAELPDAAIPAGAAIVFSPQMSPAAAHKAMEAQLASQVHVNVRGTGTAAGTVEVRVTLAPLVGEGASGTARVDIRSTGDRPLRAPPAVHPVLLEPLRKRDVLVGLVVLEPEVARERAAAIVAAMQDHVPSTGKVTTVQYRGAREPKQSTGKAAGFLTGARWKKLLEAAGTEATQVDADWRGSQARISLGRGLIPSPNAVWALAIGLPAGDAAEAAVAAAIDQAGEDVLQALLVRWGQQASLEMTPYEIACGIYGQRTLERAWVERWLRGVGPGTLWLGTALARRLDPEATGPRRISVTDVAATERALAELLPDASDWQRRG